MDPSPPHDPAEVRPWLQVHGSRGLPGWLARQRVSLAFTTYQAGKLFFVGLRPEGTLAVFERTVDRCMGLCASRGGQDLWLGSRYQLWRFANVLRPGGDYQGHDRLYVPRVGHTTGDLDVHDVAVEADGRAVFVATRFNCLATLDDRDSFRPLWRPPFVSRLVPEDRCHLNGLALHAGRARFATAVARSDVADGWREHRRDGGVVLDLLRGEVIAEGLSMPHSPRVRGDRLWLHNSGTGQFGSLPLGGGAFAPLASCPGYLRGLDFVAGWAVVGLSRPRHGPVFGGLALDEALAARGQEALCGLCVVDLGSGAIEHWLRIEGLVTELYDVVALPDAVRPMAFGFKSDEIQRQVTLPTEDQLP